MENRVKQNEQQLKIGMTRQELISKWYINQIAIENDDNETLIKTLVLIGVNILPDGDEGFYVFYDDKWGWDCYDETDLPTIKATTALEILSEPIVSIVESDYQSLIASECDSIKELLLKKNKAYGDSAFKDINLFGETIPAKQAIICRIADKMKRMETTSLRDEGEDTLLDLIGYLILFSIKSKE